MFIGIIIGIAFFVTGVILLADRLSYRRKHEEKQRSWKSASAKRTQGQKVKYVYTVDEKTYKWTPNEIYYVIDGTSEETQVLYNPLNPQEAVGLDLIPMRKHIFWVCFCFLGGAVSFFVMFWRPSPGTTLNAPFIALFGVSVFAGIGIGFLIRTLRDILPNKKKGLFIASKAVCMNRIETLTSGVRRGRSRRVWLPVFKYKFNGVTYLIEGYSHRDKTYSNIGVPAVGGKRKIWINTKNPREVYIQRPLLFVMIKVLFALAFLIIGLFAIRFILPEVEQFSFVIAG